MSAVLALGAAYGAISLAGFAISPLDVIVIPLLVLILGINEGFLLINAWYHSDAALLYKKRFAHSVADAALPITISTFVALISFGAGIFTQSSPISRFCIFAVIAVGIEFLFQVIV